MSLLASDTLRLHENMSKEDLVESHCEIQQKVCCCSYYSSRQFKSAKYSAMT